MKKYFGTDGIRGLVGSFPITPDFALRLGYALGKVLGGRTPNPTVIIGKDTRLSGYLFESSLEAGFCYAGVDVYMAGPVPTPAIAYLAKTLHLSAGVVISASHNEYADNGIKFFSGAGTKLDDALELEIEALLEQDMVIASRLGKVMRLNDAKGRYIEFCKNTFPPDIDLTYLKIVLDCANGATYQVAPSVFKELGADVVKVACEPDGTNINYQCGSTNPKNLVKAVRDNQADLGVAFDGDGDRVVVVDHQGRIYNGDKLMYIILQAYLVYGKPIKGLVGTVMTNLAMEHALSKHGLEFVRAQVGDRYVQEELQKRNWLVGGESSGHILCLDKHTTGDGIVSALQVLAALIKLKLPLRDLVDWDDYPQTLVNVRLTDKNTSNWKALSDPIIKDAEQALGVDGRVVVRKSGTEQLVRIMVEARSEELSVEWADKIAKSMQ